MRELISFLTVLRPDAVEKYNMGVGAFLGFMFAAAVGGMDKMIIWLAVLASVDYLTGIVAAFKTGKWSSSTGYRGLFKKAFMFLVVAFCTGLDATTGAGIFRSIAIFAYATNEAGSIIENIDAMGAGWMIPKFVRYGMIRLRHDSEEKVDKLLPKEKKEGEKE